MPVLLVLSRLQGAGELFDRQNSGFSHFTNSLLRFTLRLPVISMLSHPGICLQCWVTCGPTASLGTLITICCFSYLTPPVHITANVHPLRHSAWRPPPAR